MTMVITLGGGIEKKHLQLGKIIGITSPDKKKTILPMPAVAVEPPTSQSLNGGFHT